MTKNHKLRFEIETGKRYDDYDDDLGCEEKRDALGDV